MFDVVAVGLVVVVGLLSACTPSPYLCLLKLELLISTLTPNSTSTPPNLTSNSTSTGRFVDYAEARKVIRAKLLEGLFGPSAGGVFSVSLQATIYDSACLALSAVS
jgi:hypothetical protein